MRRQMFTIILEDRGQHVWKGIFVFVYVFNIKPIVIIYL